MKNRQLVLTRLPVGLVDPQDFALREAPMPVPRENEVLIRNLFVSCDPTQRGWLNGFATYMPAVQVGDVMPAWCAGQVVESRHSGYRPGDFVWGTFSWQDYVTAGDGGIFPLTKIPEGMPASYPLGVTGITGVSAYIGMLDLAKPKPGETVVVSAAAGATGSVAAQLAKRAGARVIGIAGGEEKCRWLVDTLKLDAAIDYKREAIGKRLGELCPRGVDIYYDNVGGAMLDTLIFQMALRGRIVLCGIISHGHGTDPLPPIHNSLFLMFRSVTVMGFLIFNHLDRFAAASDALWQAVQSGELRVREDVLEGLEKAPEGLRRVFEGKNVGKQLVKVADPLSF